MGFLLSSARLWRAVLRLLQHGGPSVDDILLFYFRHISGGEGVRTTDPLK